MKLLVIDTQEQLLNPNLANLEQMISNISVLIQSARENEIEIIFIRHDNQDRVLVPGQPGFEVAECFKPQAHEQIITKQYNSAFYDTNLEQLLTPGERLIITGLQTELCVNSTIRAAHDLGYELIIPADCNSTFTNEHTDAQAVIDLYNTKLWPNKFGTVLSIEETIQLFDPDSEEFYDEQVSSGFKQAIKGAILPLLITSMIALFGLFLIFRLTTAAKSEAYIPPPDSVNTAVSEE